jgi:CRISPR-associated protein Csb2
MLAIRIDLLTGRYAATEYNDREQVEWPPHPARLFSALVATWADGEPDTADGAAELAALRWLEAQPAPAIVASPIVRGQGRGQEDAQGHGQGRGQEHAQGRGRGREGEHAQGRPAVTVFVPVNDVGVIHAPDAGKLAAATQALTEATDPAARARLDKQRETLARKLVADTAKAVAVPAKFGKHDAIGAEQALIDRRIRQPRSFPSVAPEVPAFGFMWRDADPSLETATALARLAGRLVRLGHSASMIHARIVAGEAVDPALADLRAATRFVPDDEDGELVLRWVSAGQTERLIRAHAQHQQVEPRVLPAKFVRYRQGERPAGALPPDSVFDDEWIVYAMRSGPRLPITSAVGLSRQLRRAMMANADQPIAEILSGHRASGAPSEAVHTAIVPLPFVTGPHPDGTLLGVLVALPRGAGSDDRRAVTHALEQLERQAQDAGGANGGGAGAGAAQGDDAPQIELRFGDRPWLMLERILWGEDRRATLQRASWARASRRWASATPVALDRNPGDLHDPDPAARARAFDAARATVIEAVTRIGLPAPIEVDVVRSCVLPGTAKPHAYPRFPSDARKPQRVLVHVRLVFDQPVRGPVLIGAGRYHGLGLCAPVDGRRDRR